MTSFKMPTSFSEAFTNSVFSSEEWLRYTRHIQLPQFGAGGQTRLKQSEVLVVGCGGLGCPVLLYLAAAGIGRLTVIDGDDVELTNLQRQVLYTERDLGLSKASAAQHHLSQINSSIEIQAIDQAFTLDNGEALIKDHDLVIDCTDNFATRYLINDLCVQRAKPWIFASVYQFSGQCALFEPGGPCFRCLFPRMPTDIPDCNTAGVIGVLPGLVGSVQAGEAIKYLAGLATPTSNSLLLIEALDLEFRRIQLQRKSDCVACGKQQSFDQLKPDYLRISDTALSSKTREAMLISPDQFNRSRDGDQHHVVDVRSVDERQGFHIGGDHIALPEISEAILHLPRDKTIICYCQSGLRSLDAAQQLRDAGFTALSLEGGLVQWLQHQFKKGLQGQQQDAL